MEAFKTNSPHIDTAFPIDAAIDILSKHSQSIARKILIVGPLGAGKSSLAYAINKRYQIPRLNLDEIQRNPQNGAYNALSKQMNTLNAFKKKNAIWVAEGCQKHLYEKLNPTLVIDMRVGRWTAVKRFVVRFWKAQKLIGKNISPDLPVQAYHYRKTTFQKIKEYDSINREINAEIALFLKECKTPVLTCRGFKDYAKIFDYLNR